VEEAVVVALAVLAETEAVVEMEEMVHLVPCS